MNCIQCHQTFSSGDLAGSISGSIMGDEYTDSFYLCPVCRAYTLAQVHDNFTGVESETVSGPVSEPEGKERVELIMRCSTPWDKKCRCAAHLAYFNNALD